MNDLLALLRIVVLYFCHFPIWCPESGMVLDCIDSLYLPSSQLCMEIFTRSKTELLINNNLDIAYHHNMTMANILKKYMFYAISVAIHRLALAKG